MSNPNPSRDANGGAAILYAAKSTTDARGSIPDQLADCRALAERDGLTVVAEYSDEAASAYSGDRGDGLTRALADCEHHAADDGACTLVVQHSDRLARGDGKQARHLVEVALWALKHDVTIRSVQDPQTFGDLLYAVVTGQRNHEDSARKSAATRDGLRRRRERRQPVGALPEGYRVEACVGEDGRPHTERVIDEHRRALVERIMDAIEDGQSPGDVARTLNRDDVLTRRGKRWVARTVRRIAENADYTGATGYPVLIDAERHARVLAALRRMDPTAVQARKGGRAPVEHYPLRGTAFCGRCGAPMYTRRFAAGRHYICANVRQATGLCDMPPIPAAVAENAVLENLDHVVDDARDWLAKLAAGATAERDALARAVDRERERLATADTTLAHGRRYLADAMARGEDKAAQGFASVMPDLEAEREQRADAVRAAEARLSEWTTPPDIDAALDLYRELREFALGRIDKARGAGELGAALRSLVAGLVLYVPADDADALIARVYLRGTPTATSLALVGRPEQPGDDVRVPAWLQTETQTFVYVHPVRAQMSA